MMFFFDVSRGAYPMPKYHAYVDLVTVDALVRAMVDASLLAGALSLQLVLALLFVSSGMFFCV